VSPETPDFIVGDWLVRPLLGQASRDGAVVHLEPKAMEVLVALARSRGEVLSRQALIDAVWPGTFVEDQAVTRAVWQLRQALGWQKDEGLETIPKRGYRLTAPVRAPPSHAGGPVVGAEPAPSSAPQPPAQPALDSVEAPDARQVAATAPSGTERSTRETTGTDAPEAATPPRAWGVRPGVAAVVGLAMFAAGLAAMWLLQSERPTVPAVVTRASLDVRPAQDVNSGLTGAVLQWIPGGAHTALAWTPDGRTLVFIGRRSDVRQIFVRPLDRDDARPLAGTEGARALAVSADGQWVAFWADGALKKVPLAGGLPVGIAASRVLPFGLAWDTRGNLYFDGADKRIFRASPSGGLEAVSVEDDYTRGAGRHMLPSLSPDGNVLVYTLRKREYIGWGDEEVVAQVLATGERKPLLKDAADARFVSPRHLVFMRRGTMFGVAFDPDALKVLGPEVPLLDGVSQAVAAGHELDATGAGQFAVASTGTLAWIPGPAPAYPERELVWVDRHGVVSSTGAPRVSGWGATLSPDGRLVVLGVFTLAGERVWIYDLARRTLSVVNTEADASWENWSHDGQRVIFRVLSQGRFSLAWQRIDGTRPLEVLAPGVNMVPSSWTPDGRQLGGCFGGGGAAVASIDKGQAQVEAFTRTPPIEGCLEFSPDGRWLAYFSTRTGRREVYVQPYPGPGPTTRVSPDGGSSPAWSRNGRELFFLTPTDAAGNKKMMVVEFTPASQPRPARMLFQYVGRELRFDCSARRCYDVSLDGQRFLVPRPLPSPPPAPVTHISLVENWLQELEAKVPAPR